jgi:hypothetical protein
MTRPTLPPPAPETIAAEAACQYGVTLAPGRAAAIAGDVGRMLAAVERATPRLVFEDEPAQFPRLLRDLAR